MEKGDMSMDDGCVAVDVGLECADIGIPRDRCWMSASDCPDPGNMTECDSCNIHRGRVRDDGMVR